MVFDVDEYPYLERGEGTIDPEHPLLQIVLVTLMQDALLEATLRSELGEIHLQGI